MSAFYSVHADGRMEMIAEHDLDHERPLSRGRRVKKWHARTLVYRLSKGRPIEDAPWVDTAAFLASDRLKKIIEDAMPGTAQFLPVTIVGPGASRLPGPYWFVNWLRVVDALNRDRCMSVFEGEQYVCGTVIDPRRVPEDVMVFRVKDFEVHTVARAWFRTLCRRHAVTGVRFADDVPCEPEPASAPEPEPPQKPRSESAAPSMRPWLSLAKSGDPRTAILAALSRFGVEPPRGLADAIRADRTAASSYIKTCWKSPPPHDIVALLVGLYESPSRRGHSQVRLYLAGSEWYSASNPDWGVKPAWSPRGPHLQSRAMTKAQTANDSPELLEALGIAYGGALVLEALRRLGLRRTLGTRRRRYVGIGWDEGDAGSLGALLNPRK